MATYLVTGSASGMGAASAMALREQGHRVIGLDLRDAEITADLSTAQGRAEGARRALELCDGVLDGAVLAAGLGPAPGCDRPRLIFQVNYFGVVELLESLHDALAAAPRAKVVVFSSNSATTMPAVPGGAISALLRGDVQAAQKRVRVFGKNAPSFAYGASKIAVTRWMRRQAVTPRWAGEGIRLNAIAPGAILTPLLEKQLSSPDTAKAVTSFPVPVSGYGKPEDIAAWVAFMLTDAADFLCGSVITVDGGSEAWFRADDWPRAVPARRLLQYLKRIKSFAVKQ